MASLASSPAWWEFLCGLLFTVSNKLISFYSCSINYIQLFWPFTFYREDINPTPCPLPNTYSTLAFPMSTCTWWSTTIKFSIFPINSSGKVRISKQCVRHWGYVTAVLCRDKQCFNGTFAAWTALCFAYIFVVNFFTKFSISPQLFHPIR